MRRNGTMNGSERDGVRGPDGRTPRLLRRAVLPTLLVAAFAATGCATKNDLKQVRSEMIRLQERQDSLFSQLAAQNRVLMDTLRTSTELVLRVRGDLGYQLQQMEQQLIQIQELTGQSQRRLADLRQQWEVRSEQFASGSVPTMPSASEGAGAGGEPDQLYGIGIQKLEEGAASTARAAFEQIVNAHSTHPRAPDAQYQLAETYVQERSFDRALQEFERVIELFPNSARAPQALYRAGVVSEERGNISRAREYFTRVRSGYPQSEEARLAGDALRRLRGR